MISAQAERLLAILTSAEPHRNVYRGDRTQRWFVTHGGGEFSSEAVRELVNLGRIASVHSDCAEDAYHVGRTLDCKRTAEARKKYGKRAELVYVDDPVVEGAR